MDKRACNKYFKGTKNYLLLTPEGLESATGNSLDINYR
jgi:hypothetical protein